VPAIRSPEETSYTMAEYKALCQSVSGMNIISPAWPEPAQLSPNEFEPFVKAEFFVRSQNGNLLRQGLGNDLPIKGVSMVKG
jgi:hypothetical protein